MTESSFCSCPVFLWKLRPPLETVDDVGEAVFPACISRAERARGIVEQQACEQPQIRSGPSIMHIARLSRARHLGEREAGEQQNVRSGSSIMHIARVSRARHFGAGGER
jgi:uncharacterized protein YerC